MAKAEERALVPLEELSVDFYGDEVITVIVDVDGKELVYIPIRPICEYLGLSPNGQRERIQRNRILSKKARIIRVAQSNLGGSPDMFCIPLDYLNGWLFGVDVNRVKEEHQERVLLYQAGGWMWCSRSSSSSEFLSKKNGSRQTSSSVSPMGIPQRVIVSNYIKRIIVPRVGPPIFRTTNTGGMCSGQICHAKPPNFPTG